MAGGKKHGLAREYYPNGKVYQEIYYANGIKEGVARRFYETGYLYQETPYDSGRIHGIQKKYRANGKLTAEIPWHLDRECVGLVEYTLDGEVKRQYPGIQVTPVDQLKTKNTYTLKLSMSDHSRMVEYYTGRLTDSKFIGADAERVWGGEDATGSGYIKYTVLPGMTVSETLNIIAKLKTVQGNYFITQKPYRVSISN